MSKIFERLPDKIFSPLASQNRKIYASLLIELYPLFFDQIHPNIYPSRETVRFEIEDRLAAMKMEWLDEEDDFNLADSSPASTIYRRLRDIGWLDEEHQGYHVNVTIPPAVALLWSSLMEIARPEKVIYGGMVLSIHNNLQQALKSPNEQALALRQAAADAKRFHQHLNTMVYGLKGVLESFSELDDHRKMLSGFFEEFVEHFLVQDYKRLTTRNNPFRFRQKILDGIRHLEFNGKLQQVLVSEYIEQGGEPDSESAWKAVNSDIDRLRQVFEQIDTHLEHINRYRSKVERRVADAVRYLDRSQPGMSAQLTRLCEKLEVVTHDDDDDEIYNWIPLISTSPLGMGSLYEPKKARTPPEPHPLKVKAASPELKEKQRLMRAYLDRRRIDPKRIISYLEQQLGQKQSLSGHAMNIQSVEDFIAFSHVRHLTYLGGAGNKQVLYSVELVEELIDNEWLRCPGFIVHRLSKGINPKDS